MEEITLDAIGFLWDQGNRNKNLRGHGVTDGECEEVFFNRPIVDGPDAKHSTLESRHYLLGQTNAGRLLFLVYTVRRNQIRVISARDMDKKERNFYAQQN